MGGSPEYQQFMLGLAVLLAVVGLLTGLLLPRVLRRRRERARRELALKVTKARARILEDSVVEGPKGPYVPHKPWGVGTDPPPTNDTSPPRAHAYHGGPWS